MYDIKWIRENREAFDRGLRNRNAEPQSGAVIALDDARKAAVSANQAAQERRNALSKEIGRRWAGRTSPGRGIEGGGGAAEGAGARARGRRAGGEQGAGGCARRHPQHAGGRRAGGQRRAWQRAQVDAWRQARSALPAQGALRARRGAGADGFRGGGADERRALRGAEGALARLQRALGQFFVDTHTTLHGYQEVDPPLLVRDQTMFGTAQLPKFEKISFFSNIYGIRCFSAVFSFGGY